MSPEIERVIAGQTTVSGKIRALDAAGYKRADIARILDKRYQHVRNVLEESVRKASPDTPAPIGVAEANTTAFLHNHTPTYKLEVGSDGSVTLPPEVLQRLGTRPGGVIIADLGEDTFTMISAMSAVRRIQTHFTTLPPHPDGKLMSDELIEDRRREAQKDEREAF